MIIHETNSGERRGLVSVAVLIALFVLALICAGSLKVAVARRSEVVRHERRVQAGLLADSGVDRAVSRLGSSDDYGGETWEIPAGEFGGRGGATVLIRVEKVADRADRRRVLVQADYPAGSGLRSRQSREVVVVVPPSSR